MIDKTSADLVDIKVEGNRVWVGVDGECLFRVYNCKEIVIDVPSFTGLRYKLHQRISSGSFERHDVVDLIRIIRLCPMVTAIDMDRILTLRVGERYEVGSDVVERIEPVD